MDVFISDNSPGFQPLRSAQPLFDSIEEMWGDTAPSELSRQSQPAQRGESQRGHHGAPVQPVDVVLAESLSALERLSRSDSLLAVSKGAIEILRYLGLERVAIYLLDPVTGLLHGTFGTNWHGQTTDETSVSYSQGTFETLAHRNASMGLGSWLTLRDAPQIEHGAAGPVVLARGWVAMTPLRGRSGPVGIIYNDAAIGRGPQDDRIQERVAVFASYLSAVLERFGHTHRAPRPPAALVAQPAPRVQEDVDAGVGTSHSAVRHVMEALRREPRLTGGTLSARVGLSDGHLARLFKAEAGISMVEYRNRLRLDRFFASVDAHGSNLLDASRKAGFGSYAQFHRVFRRLVGMAPRDYLARLKLQPAAQL